MRIYFDVCCLCRPFDDQRQERIRLESEAVRMIVEWCIQGRHVWICSDIVAEEIRRNPDAEKRGALLKLLENAGEIVTINDTAVSAGQGYHQMSVRGLDALHLAVAEQAACDVFLTTDDKLRRKAANLKLSSSIRVRGPIEWLVEETAHDN